MSRQPERMQLLARGAFSITLQQTTAAALARGEFPVKTPNEPDRWNWVHCQVDSPKHRRPFELVMPDMAGEALMEENSEMVEQMGVEPTTSALRIRWVIV